MTTRRATRVALLALSALVATACGQPGRPIAPRSREAAAPAAPATVRVTNHNWATAVVYASIDGRLVRLGEVETGAASAWVLPASAHAASQVALVAALIGSDRSYTTGPLLLGSGGTVRLTLENSLGLSSFTVDDQ